MVAPYVRELLMVRNTEYICWSPYFEWLYAAMATVGETPIQFEELGSTLFSTIDKFEKLDRRYQAAGQTLQLAYAGIEVSQLLIDLATALHHDANLTHFSNWQEIPVTKANILARSYQSTSYALRTTEELFAWFSRAKFGIHGVWWSIDGSEQELSMAGNRVTLFDPDKFKRMALEAGFELTVIKSELHSYGDTRFSSSWIMLNKLPLQRQKKMVSIIEAMNLPSVQPVCDLNKKDLSAQFYVGSHAGFSAIKTNSPLDFYSNQLLNQWHRYVRPN